MKKMYFSLVALLLSVSASAGTWYVCGDGTNMGWDPSNPLELNSDEFILAAVSECKISTTKGATSTDWDTFNAGAITVAERIDDTPTTLPFISGDGNITFGWKGNWSVSINTNDEMITFSTSTPKPTSDYYTVAGNGTIGNPWCNGVAWSPDSDVNKLQNGSITFANVPVIDGEYKFKVTKNGSWGGALDYNALDLSIKEDFTADADNNITFELEAASNITISLTNNNTTIYVEFSTPTAVEEAQVDSKQVNKVFKTIENGQVLLNYPDGSQRNMLGQPVQNVTRQK